MASLTVQTYYRPLRIGFLIRHGDIGDLLTAAKLNTALWGGIYNPIVPVGGDPDLPDRLIRAFHVDVLHPVSDEPSVGAVFSNHSWLVWPEAFRRSGLIESDNGDEYLAALDVMPAIRYWADRQLRYVNERNGYVIPCWDVADPLNKVFCLQFGQYAEAQAEYAHAFEKEMNAERMMIGARSVPKDLAERRAPIELTRYGLAPMSAPFVVGRGVYVGNPDDFEDLLNYWNLRAGGIRLLSCPMDTETTLADYTREYLSALQEQATGLRERHAPIGIWGTRATIQSSEAKARVADVVPAGARVAYLSVGAYTWTGQDVRPPIYAFESQTVLADIDDRPGLPHVVTLALPRRPIPDAIHSISLATFQQCAVAVRAPTEHAYEGHTLRPPNCPDLNAWYGERLGVRSRSVRVQPDGVAIIARLDKEILRLTPIRTKDLIIKLLEHSEIRATASRAGRIAERLIQQMGGVEGCGIFKLPGVRNLIEDTAARKGITRNRAAQLIRDQIQDGNSIARRYGIHVRPAQNPGAWAYDIFDRLLTRDILRPGLVLSCPNCALDSWLPVNALRDQCSCDLCGHQFPIGPQLRSKGEWRFRLSGLFGRDDHQQGSVPVALTLLQLHRLLDRSGGILHWATALALQGQSVNCESDIVGVHADQDGRTSFLIGECKTNLYVESTDIEKLVAAQHAISNAGFSCYLIFSKTSPAFTDTELQQFRALRSDGCPVILFTASELEPYYPYGSGESRRALPHLDPFTLDEMASNSAGRYLEPAETP